MKIECKQVREHLSAFDPGSPPMQEVADHLESCAGCRAEQAGYRELAAALEGLEMAPLEPPHWLLSTVTENTLKRLRRTAPVRATGRQIGEHRLAAGGASVLVAGVAASILVGRSRRRARRLRVTLGDVKAVA